MKSYSCHIEKCIPFVAKIIFASSIVFLGACYSSRQRPEDYAAACDYQGKIKNLTECDGKISRQTSMPTPVSNLKFGLNLLTTHCTPSLLSIALPTSLESCDKYDYSYRVRVFCVSGNLGIKSLEFKSPLRMKSIQMELNLMFNSQSDEILKMTNSTDYDGVLIAKFSSKNPVISSKISLKIENEEINATNSTEAIFSCEAKLK